MCGIAGIIGEGASEATVLTMVSALSHRGPDGSGVWADGEVALGHTRLAIIDPGPSGAQPFAAKEEHQVCTYNGEIYNYPELRGRLSNATTSCDTELFARLPLAALVPTLRGMYAVAVHDTQTNTTFLTRDPLAIKPLYVARSENTTVFASEIGAVLASGLVEAEIAPTLVPDILRFGASVHPRSAIAGIERSTPGVVATAAGGGTTPQQSCVDTSSGAGPLAEAVRDSVRAHLLADVEVGLFLSGGVDSSVIARCLRDLAAPATAITVRVRGAADEVPAARETASTYGLAHEVVDLGEDELLEACHEYFHAMDVPAADGFNTFLVARAARATGLKVCLSGAGADELLGGYAISSRLRRMRYARILPPILRRRLAASLRRSVQSRPGRRLADALEHADDALELTSLAHRIFSEATVRELTTEHADLAGTLLDANDRCGYLRDVLLADADVFGMANSIEIRVPFVDRTLIHAVESVSEPPTKTTLVAQFNDELLDRRSRAPKVGFSLPLDSWMRGPLRPMAERLAAPAPDCLQPYLHEANVAAHFHGWRSQLGPHPMEIWTLLILYHWGDRYEARVAEQ